MLSEHTKEHVAGQTIIKKVALASRGWVEFSLPKLCESDLRVQLLKLAGELGVPVETRPRGGLVDVLSPTVEANARPSSLSKQHDLSEFPLHVDTAHWLTPCRYVMLACICPGIGNRSTLLLDSKKLTLSARQRTLLHTIPLRIRNGRNSFFSTILSHSRQFVRFDPGCMSASTPDGIEALRVFARDNWELQINHLQWEEGTVRVLDNWRILHGRGTATGPDHDRKLLRLSII